MAELKLLIFSFTLPLLLVLIAFIFKKKRIVSVSCFMLGFLWLYLPSTPLVAYGMAEYWQSKKAFRPGDASASKAGAIVILSGGYNRTVVEYPRKQTLSPSTLSRLRYGATLAKSLNLPVLLTGGVFEYGQPISVAEQMATVLEKEFSVSAKWLEKSSKTTAQNAKHSATLLAADKVESIVLVTSALHMPRAIMSFERYGFVVIPAPTIFERSYIKMLLFKLIPRSSSFELSKRVFHEMLGYWVYKLHTLP